MDFNWGIIERVHPRDHPVSNTARYLMLIAGGGASGLIDFRSQALDVRVNYEWTFIFIALISKGEFGAGLGHHINLGRKLRAGAV